MNSTAKAAYISPQTRRGQLDKFRRLLWALVVREFKGRYRRSVLGPAWAIIQPLFLMVIFVFIRKMLNISRQGVNDALYVYCVMVPWTFFTNSIMRCGPSIYSNGSILKKVAMPREVFPLSEVAASFVDLFVASLILVGMMIWYGVGVGWSLLWVPVLVLLTALLAMGIGLAVAAVGTYKQDIIFGVPLVLQVWLLACPIMYELADARNKLQGPLYTVYVLNPMVGIVDGFRNALLFDKPPDLNLLAVSMVVTAVVWLVAWPLFRYTSQYFADVL